MRVDAGYREDVLIRLGANRIAEVRNAAGDLEGYEISPDVDIDGYDSACESILAEERARALSLVIGGAERATSAVVTCLPGRVHVYALKVSEAREALASKAPKPSEYPMLASTIGVDGETIIDVARLILRRSQECIETLSAIERVRGAAIAEVSTATSAADIGRVLSEIVWPV